MRALIILMLLFASTVAPPSSTVIPGATVQTEQSCRSGHGSVSYLLTSTGTAVPRYIIPGITAYPHVELLSTQPGQVALTDEVLTWRPSAVGDVAVVIGVGAPGCPPAGFVTARWSGWLSLVLR